MVRVCINRDLSIELDKEDECLFSFDVEFSGEKIRWKDLEYYKMVVEYAKG